MSLENPTGLLQLKNNVLKYHWGVPGGISSKLGYAPENSPEAELWIGAHPKAPSIIATSATTAQPQTLEDLERLSGKKMPYLLKMLAVGEALSIQAHPTLQQATAGFAAENSANIPLDAPHRNYRDTNSKPELIVALADGFAALCGFRSPQESSQLLRSLCDTALAVDPHLADAAAAVTKFCQKLTHESLKTAVLWALREDAETAAFKKDLLLSLQKLAAAVTTVAPQQAPKAIKKLHGLAGLLQNLSKGYPQDSGILVAALLNEVQLKSGQALWLPPGTPHAYLCGYGVEIMSSSDNVLRGGLTEKHIDPNELAKVLNFKHGGAHPFTPVVIGSNYRYNPDPEGIYAAPFELVRVVSECAVQGVNPLSVLVVSGSFELAAGAHRVTAERGDSYFVPGGEVQLRGAGEAYIAGGALRRVTAKTSLLQGAAKEA